ncbi:IS1004 transposase [Vibrio cholerae]|nr:IS1004 transposase [Vibrio cholerae]
MGDYRSSSHVYWRCKYHIVWTPKFRFKILKGNVAKELNRSIYILRISVIAIARFGLFRSPDPAVFLSSYFYSK